MPVRHITNQRRHADHTKSLCLGKSFDEGVLALLQWKLHRCAPITFQSTSLRFSTIAFQTPPASQILLRCLRDTGGGASMMALSAWLELAPNAPYKILLKTPIWWQQSIPQHTKLVLEMSVYHNGNTYSAISLCPDEWMPLEWLYSWKNILASLHFDAESEINEAHNQGPVPEHLQVALNWSVSRGATFAVALKLAPNVRRWQVRRHPSWSQCQEVVVVTKVERIAQHSLVFVDTLRIIQLVENSSKDLKNEKKEEIKFKCVRP